MPSHQTTSHLQAINNDKTIQLTFNGTALGFDFGLKRIGVASGEHLLGIAHPLTTLHKSLPATLKPCKEQEK